MINDTSNKSPILNFSPHLFWDVDNSNLDMDKDKKWIINRVLEYGLYNDWLLIKTQYGLKQIANSAFTMRDLSKKTVSFLSTLADVPKEKFICYTSKQSHLNCWNS